VQSRPRARIAWLFALVAVCLAARLVLLRERPLWHDETFTVWAARLTPPLLSEALRSDSGPPLFYVLERPFASAARSPERDPLVRIFPFAAGLLLFAAARTLPRGPARAWWVGLCACFALGNLYAAEARAYAPLSVLGLGIFLCGVVAPETAGLLAGLFVLAAAALWMHYLAIFVVVAALGLAASRRRWRACLALAAALLAFAPWVPVLLAQPAGAMAWLRDSPSLALTGFLSALGGAGRIPAPFGPAPPPAVLGAGAFLGAALFALLLPAARRDAEVRAALLLVALVLALAFGASVWRPFAFAGRCEMAILPVWMWALARAAPRSRALAVAASLAAALGLGTTVFVAAGPHPRSTPASAVASVARLARAGDTVLAGPGFYLPALVAADRGLLAARIVPLPAGDAAHPGWFVAWPLGPEDVAAAARAADAAPAGARVFLLLPPAYSQPALMAPLEQRGVLRELVRQPDGVLTVWMRKTT
jgi:hypothetical protein